MTGHKTRDPGGGGAGFPNNATGASGGACREAINSAMADVNAGAQNVISSIEGLQSQALMRLKEYQDQIQLLDRERLQLQAEVGKLEAEIERLKDQLAKGCDCNGPWPYCDPNDAADSLCDPPPVLPTQRIPTPF